MDGANAQNWQSPTGGNVFETSANAYTSGTRSMRAAANPYAVTATMNQFMNPYREQVIDNTVQRLRDRKAIDLNQVQTDAAAASAFGGSRHGLVEAELIDRYGQEEDDIVSRLLQQGYDTSMGLSMQNMARVGQAGQALAGAAPTGFNLGAMSLTQQQNAGAMQQAMAQQILDRAGMQTETYINWPQQSLNTALAGLRGNPLAGQYSQFSKTREIKDPMDAVLGVASLASGVMGAAK